MTLPASSQGASTIIIVPVFERLGWDHMRDIRHQYRVGNGAVDLALVRGEKPRVFIEGKELSTGFIEDGSEAAEAIHYAADEGVEWAALMDGVRWWVYRLYVKARKPVQARPRY